MNQKEARKSEENGRIEKNIGYESSEGTKTGLPLSKELASETESKTIEEINQQSTETSAIEQMSTDALTSQLSQAKNLYDITTGGMVNIDERRKHVQPAPSYANTDLVKEDVLSNELTKVHILVKDPTPYVVHKFAYTNENALAILTDNTVSKITDPTMSAFRNGTAFCELAFNQKLMDEFKITSRYGMAYHDLFTKDGETTPYGDINLYIGGIFGLLAKIADDKRVMYDLDEALTAGITNKMGIFEDVLATVPVNVGINFFLTRHSPIVRWAKDMLQEVIDTHPKNRYYLGRVGTTRDPYSMTKFANDVALNVDQYSASIWNYNLNRMIGNHSDYEKQMAKEILCYALPDTTVRMAEIGLTANEELMDYNYVLLLYCNSVLYDTKFIPTIHTINMQYLYDSGFMTPTPEASLFYEGQTLAHDDVIEFNKWLQARFDSCVESWTTYSELAAQITPQPYTCSLALVDIPRNWYQAVAFITETLLYSWYFPVTFNRIKGEVQNILLQTFSIMWPEECNAFMAGYGTKYTIENGTKVFTKKDDVWVNSDHYLSAYYPSLFSGINFANCPLITKLMSYFKPPGELMADSLAVEAGLPRLHLPAEHFNPCGQYNGTIDPILTNFRSYMLWLFREMQKVEKDNSSTKGQIQIVYN